MTQIFLGVSVGHGWVNMYQVYCFLGPALRPSEMVHSTAFWQMPSLVVFIDNVVCEFVEISFL